MQNEPTLKAFSAPPRWPPSLPSPGGSHSAEFCADHSLAFYENQSMSLQWTHPGPTVHVLCHSTVSLGRKIKTFATKMVITSGNDEDRGGQEKESKEESVLAMLGIIGTILNLIVIIFVYIYTTL
ncbi:protein TUNAR isoform X2 [Equus caballus]|uniref:protein TUNAR isoform X2 n=1 Tax=Equus caballus TaxID=9796 RepID=UPI0038B2F719